MSVSLYRWTEECDNIACCGDCDNCNRNTEDSFYGWMFIKEYKGIPPHTICGLWEYDLFDDTWSSNGSTYPAAICEKMRETERSRWRSAEDDLVEREVKQDGKAEKEDC